MKKAKFMLVAIAVCGVLGGALAFKAKTFTGVSYFTTALPNVKAPNTVLHGMTTITGASVYYTTILNDVPPTINFKPVTVGL